MKRNKRLMLADRHGWATPEAYERDPVADDSSDEKRMKRVGPKRGPVFSGRKS